MRLKQTPAAWRQGFRLYRRRFGTDSLGNETACYDMTAPDAQADEADGICVQYPRGWNTSGSVGKNGSRVEERGEVPGGVLEGYLKGDLVVNAFDRLEIGDELWEVRAVHRWPGHRQVLMQRVR